MDWSKYPNFKVKKNLRAVKPANAICQHRLWQNCKNYAMCITSQ